MKPGRGVTCRLCVAMVVLSVGALLGGGSRAAPIFRGSSTLPFSGGPGQLAGDLAWAPDGAAAVYAKPVGQETHLVFYRISPDAQSFVERVHSLAPWPCYEPALAFDGETFGVSVSGLTQAFFLVLSPAGEVVAGPVQLPGLPSGAAAGRTAGFKVIWTGQGYAVFGLWLERQFPRQELTQGSFYTHLRYWLLDRQGTVLAQKELRMLAPMTYPSVEGAERNYYDVVWTGAAFFLAYYGESEFGPPFSVYYRIHDLAGGWLRAESPLLAAQSAQGPRVAWSGRVVAATALKAISLPSPDAGNYLYLRCYGADGTPQAVETTYGGKLGYGPTVHWLGDRFLAAYCMLYDMGTLGYAILFNAFDEQGQRLGDEQPMRNAQGSVVTGRMALGVDLQFAGQGNVLYAKAQNSDAFAIKISPLWFTLNNDVAVASTLHVARDGDGLRLRWPADAAPFRLQEAAGLGAAPWTDLPVPPVFADGYYSLRVAPPGTRFYRLIR